MKRLSIITTLYNSAVFLPKCLDSLLCQDIPEADYEIIVVNDGSPDDSELIARDYAERSGTIRVICQENKGLAGARNTGIRNATGNYLYFVDPDDYILENSLSGILDIVEKEDLDILRFGYTEVDEDYRPTSSVKHPPIIDYSPEIMDGCTFMGKRLGVACYVWTYLFRTSLIKDNGLYFTEGVYFDDTPWLPKVLRLASRVDSIEFKRHFYLIRSGSLVQARDKRSMDKKIEGQKFLINEMKRQMSTTDNIYAGRWYRSMLSHCVVTLLTAAGIEGGSTARSCSIFVSSSGVLPLPTDSSHLRNRLKSRVINLSPSLFCRIIHITKL